MIREVLGRPPKNWVTIRTLIGTPLGKKPLPLEYYTRRLPGGKIVIARKRGMADDDVVAPLGVDGSGKIFLRQGSSRLSDPTLMKNNDKKMHGALPSGHQIHHLVPDNLIKDHPLGQAAERLGISLDRGENLMGLPGKMAFDPATNPAGHWSSHPQYDAIVTGLLETNRVALERAYGSLDLVPKDKLKVVMDDIADEMRDRIQKGKIPLKDGRLASAPGGPQENLA
ncbi:AHH domain-containing protein [Deinococcus arcticus]|uniref:Uncharacterized protein n=1 Tax=Deinococcus arcticus TaxID=2136176 RepID=A0A2T3W3D8_9DEIO|nr:AHH domain-containing protein [Deinococcus arcticus]PTA66387.1 hypothetical protein C8263_18285 [Deinococcus arcticus]